MEKILSSPIIIALSLALIFIIWLIKIKTAWLYDFLASNHWHNTPTKVAWILTLIILGLTAIVIW